MNPSTEDILKAANSVNAENVFIFPNNKNIVMAATQAAGLCENKAVVLATKSVPECIAAMLKFNEGKSAEDNDKSMNKAISAIKTAQVTYAVRDTESESGEIHSGDIIGVAGSNIDAIGQEPTQVLLELCRKHYDDDENEFINLYYGEDTSEQEAQKAVELIEEEFPDAEVSLNYGGQPLYYYIISVE